MSSLDKVNRRTFLGAGTSAGLMMAGQHAAHPATNSERDEFPKLRPASIYKIYIGRSGATTNARTGRTVQYLTWGKEEVAKMDNHLQDLENKLGDVKFVGGETIPPANAGEVAARAASADGLLLIWLSGHGGDYATLEKLSFGLDKPAVSFFQPFSGHGWMWHQQWKNRKVLLLSTGDWKELDDAVNLLRVPALMKQTRIIAVNAARGTKAACSAEEVKKKLGAEVVTIKNDRILEMAKAIDIKLAEAEAEQYWIKPAIGILEPTRDEIIDSARYYLAVKKLMIQEKAIAFCNQACMGEPRGCLTLSKLGRSGPGRRLRRRHRFHAHHAAVRPRFPRARLHHRPGHRRSEERRRPVPLHLVHAEAGRDPHAVCHPQPDRQRRRRRPAGAVAGGEPVTMAKLVNLDTMLAVPGKITETGTSPLACRTQFTQTVRDARHLFLNWGAGAIVPPSAIGDLSQYAGAMPMLHRAVFYGDHVRSLKRLGDLMGFKVIEEDTPVQSS